MPNTATSEQHIKLALSVIEASGAKGYARAINVFVTAPVAGDYNLTSLRSMPRVFNAKKLIIHLGEGESIAYIVLREPVSCNWMALPSELYRASGSSFDVFDLMWLSAPFSSFNERDDAIECILLEHGFLAPWITNRVFALKARQRKNRSKSQWLIDFLSPEEFDSERCNGCDSCDGGTGTIHRVPRESNDDW